MWYVIDVSTMCIYVQHTITEALHAYVVNSIIFDMNYIEQIADI